MSPITIQATNCGLLGGVFLTGGTIYTGEFAGLQSVGVTFGVTGISAAICDNVAYLTGKSFNHPFELNFPFETIQLSSGAAYAKKRVD